MTKTLPITKAREDLPTLVANAKRKWDNYEITINGVPEAVLLSKAEFDSWKETMDILSDKELMKSIRQGEKEIAQGKWFDWEDVKKELGLDVSSKNITRSKKRAQRNQASL